MESTERFVGGTVSSRSRSLRHGAVRLVAVAFLVLFGGLLVVPLRADDCNRNGQEDEVDIAEGVSADCNSDGEPDECEVASIVFGVREQGLESARFPRALVAADLNGDGATDVVTANQDADTSSTVSVLLNDGTGLFARADFDDAQRATSIAVADMDADGDLDLVTANFFTLEVLWNDGAGAFDSATSIEVERQTRFATLADVDGDGLTDVLATNTRNDDVSLFRNEGERAFAASASFDVGEYPVWVEAADFDGDGAIDVVTANRDTDDGSLLLGDGAGGFAAAVSIPFGAQQPASIDAEDFDNDGDVDLAVTSRSGLVVLYNDGDGTFPQTDTFDVDAYRVLAADLDDDGDIDLAYGSSADPTVEYDLA